MSDTIWYRGETIDFVLTVTTDGTPDDLSGATAIEMQLKSAPGAADPPLVALDLASGITRRTQTGSDIGKADIQVPFDALTGPSTPPGTYYYDVVVAWGAVRRVVVKPTVVKVRDVVNAP